MYYNLLTSIHLPKNTRFRQKKSNKSRPYYTAITAPLQMVFIASKTVAKHSKNNGNEIAVFHDFIALYHSGKCPDIFQTMKQTAPPRAGIAAQKSLGVEVNHTRNCTLANGAECRRLVGAHTAIEARAIHASFVVAGTFKSTHC